MVNLSVSLCGIQLDNPIIPASGTFGFGKEFTPFYDINELGTFSFKGTTLHPRFGNQTPRIAETPMGMLNAVGLQNPGVDHVIAHELEEMKAYFRKPVMANISGFSLEEYVETAKKLDRVEQIGWHEINISCPNVHGGGMAFGTDAALAREVTQAIKAVTTKPIIMKLSPNVRDIAEIARACQDGGADGISMINTLLGMRISLKTKKPLLSNKTGGLSGPCILPLALRMVYQVYEAVSIPIIGMGGISRAEDVLEMMLAGATCVQVGAQNLVDPMACHAIIHELPHVMQAHGIEDINTIIGGAHRE